MIEQKTITYTIPTEKKDLTLADWQEYREILTNPELDEVYKEKMAIKIFCKIPFNHIDQLKSVDYAEIIYNLSNIFNERTEMARHFTHQGVQYGLIPNFDDITVSEKADLDMYLEAGDLVRLMSILYRPITFEKGDLYTIEPYVGTHEKFQDLQYDIAENVLDFFLSLLKELQKHMTGYIEQMAMKIKTNSTSQYLSKMLLVKNIEGLRLWFGLWRMRTLLKSIQSVNPTFIRSFFGAISSWKKGISKIKN